MTTEKPIPEERLKLLAVGQMKSGGAAHADMLRRAGFELVETKTADDALKCLGESAYGLVLIACAGLDLQTLDLVQRIKRDCPEISTLVLAAGPETSSVDGVTDLIDGLLFEPVAPLELETSVRTLLRLYRSKVPVQPAEPSNHLPSDFLEARLSSLYSSSLDAIISIDGDDVVTSWSAAAEKLSGFSASEIIGKKLQEITGTEDALAQRFQYLQRLHDGEPIEYQTIRNRKDGEPIEIWVRAAPIKSEDGHTIGASFFIRDITAQKRREQHVHFLMRELTHRSKNLLAVIQAMARQSLSHLNSPEDFVTRFSARLSGLAGSHDLLSNVDWEGASLNDLIKSQLRHYEDRFDEKIHLEGPDLFLRPEAAQNIGIALHELSTNAAKYGALSVPDGNVSISWGLQSEKNPPRLHMMWQETGGPPVQAPSRKGFGHIVMDRITGQALGGTSRAEFNPAGVTWTLDVPAASVVLERDKPV